METPPFFVYSCDISPFSGDKVVVSGEEHPIWPLGNFCGHNNAPTWRFSSNNSKYRRIWAFPRQREPPHFFVYSCGISPFSGNKVVVTGEEHPILSLGIIWGHNIAPTWRFSSKQSSFFWPFQGCGNPLFLVCSCNITLSLGNE